MQDCLLDDPHLGPITEIDHKLSQCLCSECTCGRHLCPYLKSSSKPRTATKSTYQVEYRRHSSAKSKPYVRQDQLGLLRGKMDLTTMNQSFYKPHAIESPVIVRPSTTKPGLKFVSESSYKVSYPNWGPMSSTHSSPAKTNKSVPLKFTAESSYNASFTGKTSGLKERSFVHASSKNMLDMSYDRKLETTAQSFNRNASSYMRGPSYEKNSMIVQYEVPDAVYLTEFRRSYQKQVSPYKDPKAVRRSRKEVKVVI